MSAVVDEDHFDLIPREEWYEQILRYGLYVGAAFQLCCILAIIVFPPSSSELAEDNSGPSGDSGSSDEDEEELSSAQSTAFSRPNSRKKLDKKKRK